MLPASSSCNSLGAIRHASCLGQTAVVTNEEDRVRHAGDRMPNADTEETLRLGYYYDARPGGVPRARAPGGRYTSCSVGRRCRCRNRRSARLRWLEVGGCRASIVIVMWLRGRWVAWLPPAITGPCWQTAGVEPIEDVAAGDRGGLACGRGRYGIDGGLIGVAVFALVLAGAAAT